MYEIGEWVQRNSYCGACRKPVKRRVSKINIDAYTFDADQRSCGCKTRATNNTASRNQLCEHYKRCEAPMSAKYLIGDLVEIINLGKYWNGTYGSIIRISGDVICINPGDTIPQQNYRRDIHRKQGSCSSFTSSLKHKDPEPGDWVRRSFHCGACKEIVLLRIKKIVNAHFLADRRVCSCNYDRDENGMHLTKQHTCCSEPDKECPDCRLIGGFCKPHVREILASEKPRVLEPKIWKPKVADCEYTHIKGWDCVEGIVYVRVDGVNVCSTGDAGWPWQVYTTEEYPIGGRHKKLQEACDWADEHL